MSSPKIPIENVYYLFCYAWNRFEEGRSLEVGGTDSPDLPNLLARVLLAGVRRLMRRGLDRGYRLYEDELGTVRGRIELNGSLRLRAIRAPRLACVFDELSHDVVHNRIIKATMLRLARAQTLSSELAHELRVTTFKLADVADIRLTKADFGRVQLHRNNAYYDLLLKVCELAFETLLPTPDGKGFRFEDVLRDERKMAGVFEAFVRNFYRAEQRVFTVEPLQFAWDAVPLTKCGEGRLPLMRTDVFLRSPTRRIIIDTKYYAEALQEHHGVRSFHSGNLYQLFAYLKNAETLGAEFADAEGLLLYPVVGEPVDASYLIQGHVVRIATINLNQPWQSIAAEMRSQVFPTGDGTAVAAQVGAYISDQVSKHPN